jgi:hypothetical protein
MRKLIISYKEYQWLYEFYNEIINSDDVFELIIICQDGKSINHPEFCEDAIEEQRKFDLRTIGKMIKIKKLTNLCYNENNIDVYRLIFQLTLYVGMSGIKEVYCTNNEVLIEILKKFNNITLRSSKVVYDIPDEIRELMVGE